MEAYHAIKFRVDRRALGLQRDFRDAGLSGVPLACRLASQVNNSRACRADSFLTFLTASSTALIVDTLSKKLAWSKQGFEELPSGKSPERGRRETRAIRCLISTIHRLTGGIECG
jgi:hypothetical protein